MSVDNVGVAVLEVTPGARETVLSLRQEEEDSEKLGLWLEATGVSGTSYTYDLYFESLSDIGPNDVVQAVDGLSVVIPASSVDRLRGAVLDISEDGGMVLVNPNTPPAAAPMTGDLSGELAQAVLKLLEEDINPAIAAHGGRADLVAVEEGVVYLRLSGGCQGCGMATETLSQGIEVALKEALPEIVAVADVTNHAGGTNPYYH